MLSLQTVGAELRCLDDSAAVRWTVPIGELILVAEYTTDEGPFIDDYFLVFCTIEEGRIKYAGCTFYAEGSDTALRSLAEKLGSPINLDLFGSAQWASRVLWPPEFAGQPYYESNSAEARKLRENLSYVILDAAHEVFLSDRVRRYLRAQLQARSGRNPVQ